MSVQDGDVGVDYLAVVKGSRAHPIDLWLHGGNHLVVGGQPEEPVVGGDEERNGVVLEERGRVPLASSTCGECIKVLAKPLAHFIAIHGCGLSLTRWALASVEGSEGEERFQRAGRLNGGCYCRRWL